MKTKRLLPNLFFLLALLLVSACREEEKVPVFDAPTISALSDNSEPFAGDKVMLTIQVATPARSLDKVTLNGTEIKSYATDTKTDNFTYEYTVPANTAFGSLPLNLQVTDKQATAKSASASVNLNVRNPNTRGNPFLVYDAEGGFPNSVVLSMDHSVQDQGWGPIISGIITPNAVDPVRGTNKALRFDRWYPWAWGNYPGFDIKLAEGALTRADMEAVLAGTRVIQANLLFQGGPGTFENPGNLKFGPEPAGNYRDKGNKYTADSVENKTLGIPINLDLGDKEKFDFRDGQVLGRKFFMIGYMDAAKAKANEWQTVTFKFTEVKDAAGAVLNPNGAGYDSDPTIGFNEIDAIVISPNGGSAKDNGTYFIDNIRTIATPAKDQNPNL